VLTHGCSFIGASPEIRLDDGSRMTRECHVRFCERLRVKSPGSTHLGKSIDGIRKQDRSVGSRIAPTPLPILSMSLQPAIPWRVALQQSPTPLHRLSTMLREKQRLEKTITLNGDCVFNRLSQSRGSPHYRSRLLNMRSEQLSISMSQDALEETSVPLTEFANRE
jgi:hypothetical protein